MIIQAIPPHLHTQAATIFWEAFNKKLGKILGPDERAIAFFYEVMQFENAIGALSDDGNTLLGLAGFDLGKGGFIGGGMRDMIRHYGLIGGTWRGVLLEFFTRPVADDCLQMDGIAVHPNARGQGVGSNLLAALVDIASEHQKAHIHLDVIDVNPRAKTLYERFGFERISHTQTGLFRHIFGFSASDKMQLTL